MYNHYITMMRIIANCQDRLGTTTVKPKRGSVTAPGSRPGHTSANASASVSAPPLALALPSPSADLACCCEVHHLASTRAWRSTHCSFPVEFAFLFSTSPVVVPSLSW